MFLAKIQNANAYPMITNTNINVNTIISFTIEMIIATNTAVEENILRKKLILSQNMIMATALKVVKIGSLIGMNPQIIVEVTRPFERILIMFQPE